jgi:mannose-6-phosphate isomerase
MNAILRFHPLYQERVWGGRALADFAGRVLPGDRAIGESWEIVDRPEAQSVVRHGPWAGRTLRAVLAEHTGEVMGPRWPAERPFPILVKWLDCRERLSLQVHPPAALAGSLGGEPKTENWFIAEATADAALIVGLQPGVSRERFAQAIADQSLESCVRRLPVAAGDSILVRSGTVHAIDAGSLILEIQQNSDTTYRVYDWGRLGLDGKPRQLHVRESLASIQFGAKDEPLMRAGEAPVVLADCAEFRLRCEPLSTGATLSFLPGQQPRIVSVVSGGVRIGAEELRRGDNALVPFDGGFTLSAQEQSVVLVTENFAAT